MSRRHNGSIDFGKYEKEEEKPKFSSSPPSVTFSFKYICQNDYSPARCSYPQLKSFNDKLRMLSSLSWSAIDSSPRETNGYELLSKNILKRTVPSAAPNISNVMVFRFGGGSGSKNSGRIAGYKADHIFYVLFVDPKLDLYDHSN